MKKLLKFLLLHRIKSHPDPKIANLEKVLRGKVGTREYAKKYNLNPAEVSHWIKLLRKILE